MRLGSLFLLLLMLLTDRGQSRADTITILELNADISSELELDDIEGSGSRPSSNIDILTTPSIAMTPSTFAEYSVTRVDMNGDDDFNDSFVFRLTFSSPEQVNFHDSLEYMALGNDVAITPGDEFTMTVDIISDSSATHDVVFDGVTELNFFEMDGVDLGIVSTSGNSTITLNEGNTSLGSPFFNPTLTYLNSGVTSQSGMLENWSLQFSTVPASSGTSVPEPSSMIVVGLFGAGIAMRRFKHGKRKSA